MGRSQFCQRCGEAITVNTEKVGIKRKICWKVCKVVLKHAVAELMNDDWVSTHKDTALYNRGRQGQAKAQLESAPYLCQMCIAKAEAASVAKKREVEAAKLVASVIQKKAEAAVAAATAAAAAVRSEAETRAYCLMLLIGCFICVFVSVGVCAWCFMRG